MNLADGKSVTILGLCVVHDNTSHVIRSINETKKVFTLNDFYRPIAYPWLDNECCDLTAFQIHNYLPDPLPEGRFNHWKWEYNLRVNRAVVRREWKGLDNQEIFPFEKALEIFPVGWFASTFGFITAYAYLNDIRDMRFFGFSLREAAHYRDSIPGCLYIFQHLRKIGVTITAPVEETWLQIAKESKIDWTSIPDVKVMYGE